MILLALAQLAAILKISSINTQRSAIFIHSLAAVNYKLPRGETLFHLPLTHILEIFKDFFACKIVLAPNRQHPKIFKDFSVCKIVLAANRQHPKIFKDFSVSKIVLAANYHLYPGNFRRLSGQQPAAAINSSNQQQQPAAATSSSNQQQQTAAATNSSNQQQQSKAAININDQISPYQQYLHNPRRPPLVTNTVPSRGYVLLEVDLGLAARLRVQPPLPRLIFVTFPLF